MDPQSAAARHVAVIAGHLNCPSPSAAAPLALAACLRYDPPELSENPPAFDLAALRRILDGHDLEARDWLFRLMEESPLFCPRRRGDRTFVAPDYNQTKEQQRAVTMRRIEYLLRRGVFEGWVTGSGPEAELRKLAFFECIAIYDHSLSIKLGVTYFLWGGAIRFFGTKRHHDKWLKATEDYQVKGCFAMTELGHGSNVRGIETIAIYDTNTGEFVINTPCESAQKYWIGGAANHATHTIIFSQLLINGTNQGIHAFVAQIRDADGNVCPNVRIADCGHKIGLNGVDNGRIWFDNLRVPRENLLNSVADVLPDGQYVSSIKDKDKRFAAFMAPLTFGRVNIAATAVYISKVALAITVRYALTRRAFSISANGPEECRKACGGQGLKTENRIGILNGEYDVQSTFEGDNNVLMQQVSKALLAEYLAAEKMKSPFNGLGLEHMNDPCPIIPANLTSCTIRSIKFQLDLLCLRERDLLGRYAGEVSQYQAQGESKQKAVLLSHQLADELARAFTERTILQTFADDEMTQSAGPLKELLGLLRSMYALICVEEDASFLRYGYLSLESAAAVRKEVMKLCGDLRPHALSVAFHVLPTPIWIVYLSSLSWLRHHARGTPLLRRTTAASHEQLAGAVVPDGREEVATHVRKRRASGRTVISNCGAFNEAAAAIKDQ
ncbi:acyl-coenzyme A oxidase [Musa troglodytarum]|uniref:Acyl-coenzyme A oxidase n=1 Tax=Musa troglodytarum TaxID=320322 RepID=A0A9E7JM47_9LILI|nr:acyl-coenzyme A oxidase [Musa troglodytarum]